MDLHYTETNASDDSAGRAFGLDGNLYLPLVVASLGGIAIAGLLVIGSQVRWTLAAGVAGVPLATVGLWIVGLKRGRPAGFDRDWLEHLAGGEISLGLIETRRICFETT